MSRNHEKDLAKALARIKVMENDYAARLSKVREGAYDQGPAGFVSPHTKLRIVVYIKNHVVCTHKELQMYMC